MHAHNVRLVHFDSSTTLCIFWHYRTSNTRISKSYRHSTRSHSGSQFHQCTFNLNTWTRAAVSFPRWFALNAPILDCYTKCPGCPFRDLWVLRLSQRIEKIYRSCPDKPLAHHAVNKWCGSYWWPKFILPHRGTRISPNSTRSSNHGWFDPTENRLNFQSNNVTYTSCFVPLAG
jgi:hypothetical protein